MSTQSGIVASTELLDSFRDFKGDALVIKINSENTQLIPDRGFNALGASGLSDSLDNVRNYLEKSYPSPAYVVIRVSKEGSCFISFVPDVAPIRQKMLYASTKNTLVTTLGSNNFIKSQIFSWTDLDEISYSHYESATSENKDVPLTESEKIMNEIDSLQAMSLAESKGTSVFQKQLVSMSANDNLLFGFSEELSQELNKEVELDSGKNNLITFNIDLEKEIFNLANFKASIQVNQLIDTVVNANVSPSPQYIVYNYQNSKYAFIYTCPSGSKVKERMVYASLKRGLYTHLKNLFESKNKALDKSLEVGDIHELEISELEISESANSSSAPSTRNGLKFSKPKGPRRR